MIDAVHRYEGTVNQVLGDGIMALFGAPLAHEDHAVRACYAALDMQASMLRYSEELQDHQGLSLKIGVGLNSGEVVVRTIGNDLHMEYSAVGQTTNLSAKMQAAAKPATILITKETARLVEGLVETESLEPVRVEGIVDPIEAFELLDVTSSARRLQVSIAQGLTRFVGRETEFATFQSVIREAARGEGQLVAIFGEAGVGKSRLIYEFLNSDWCDEWTVLQSSSVSYGKVRAYFPVIHLLRRYFELADNVPPEKVEKLVKTKLPELSEHLQESIPPVLALLDALPSDDPFHKLEAREQHRATLEALRSLLFYESQRSPLIVIFEDLHCIDNATQIFLDSVVEMLPTSRMVLLVDYRPEYRHDWGHKTYYTQMRLSQLSPEAAHDVLDVLLGNDRGLTNIKQLLAERTQGNPFFLEEMTRTLAEASILVGDKGAYRLTQIPERLEIPSTVQAVLAARIDRLTPEQKELLQTAAVIGRDIPLPLLEVVSELEASHLQQALSNLTGAEFIYETQLYPDRAFTFKHALTHEVAYESLLREKRRALHAKIVAVLERSAGGKVDEQVERIAPHAMLGELWDKAVWYFWKSGTRAMSRSAFNEARACFESALEAMTRLSPSPENQKQTIDLRLELRNAMFMLGDFKRVYEHLEVAEQLATALNDEERLRRTLNFMSSHFTMRGQADRALECGERALSLARAQEDIAARTVTRYYLGIANHYIGNYAQAAEHNRAAISPLHDELKYERFGTSAVVSVMCRNWMVQSLAELGEFDEGIQRGHEGIALARESKHLYSLTYVTCSLGFLHFMKGEPETAIPLLEECLSYCEKGVPLFPHVAGFLGASYILAKRLTDAISLLEDADAQTSRSGRFAGHAVRLTRLGEAYLQAGRVEDAHTAGRRAVEIATQHGEQGNKAWARRLRGEIFAAEHPKEAEKHYIEVLATAEALGMRPLEAHCRRSLGAVYTKIGRAIEARALLSRSIELYRDMGMQFWLPESEELLGSAQE